MKAEASCSGVPVLLLKVTTDVIVLPFSRGVAATRAAQRRERRAHMMKAQAQ
jgi:hypothetical protein